MARARHHDKPCLGDRLSQHLTPGYGHDIVGAPVEHEDLRHDALCIRPQVEVEVSLQIEELRGKELAPRLGGHACGTRGKPSLELHEFLRVAACFGIVLSP